MQPNYQMSDAQFAAELRIRAYIDQIDGYPFGHPRRQDFEPIIPMCGDRAETLDAPCYFERFSGEERAAMLALAPPAPEAPHA